jgi:omega-amidase
MSSSSSTSASATGMESTSLRVALCQFPVTADKDINHATARKYLAEANENGAKLVVLPEIWNSPYATSAFPNYAETLPDIGAKDAEMSASSQLLIDAATKYKMWVVGGSIPEKTTNLDDGTSQIFNTCLVVNPDGEIVAKHRKVHLFDIDVPGKITFFESDTLSPGSTVSHFTTPWGEIGVGICYDIRFAEYAQILRHTYNVCVLIYPGAFNMTTGPAHWEILQRARAVDNQCYVLTASPSRTTLDDKKEDSANGDGGDSSSTSSSPYPHYTAWGHSTAVSPWGDIVATTDEKEGIVMADLDLQRVSEVRSGIPIGSQRRTDLYKLQHEPSTST